MKKISSFLIFLCINSFAFATHEMAGQITHKYVSGYTYEISVTTYTKGTSSSADRCSVIIHFGDNDSALVCRSNFEAGDPNTDLWGANGCTGNPNCGTHHMGEWTIGSPSLQSMNIKKNVYTVLHTYGGGGAFPIRVFDPNFEDDIINIPAQSFMALLDTIVIGVFNTSNSNPTYSQIPIDTAILFQPYIYNPGAIDPDGDSLTYRLITPPQVSGYFFPDAPGNFGIDAVTGDVFWNTPQTLGKYVFCIEITEWKKFAANGLYYWAGSSMQIVSVRTISAAGVNESFAPKVLINTFPNPASSEISFMVSNIADLKNSLLEIFDHTGRKIKSVTPTELPVSLDASQFAGGIYYCRFTPALQPSIHGKFEVLR